MKKKKDYGIWSIPISWAEITLKMYSDISRYYADKDKNFDVRDVLHIFTDKSVEEINELPIEVTERLMSKLLFLNEKPNDIEPSNKIVIDGEEYVINVMEKLKTGEYITVDTILKDDKYDYASILAVLCRKQGEVFDSKFEAEVFEGRKEMFEKQPLINVLPIVGFFLNLCMTSEIPSLLCSEVEGEIDRTAKLIETSERIGVFRKSYLKWQMRKLRKSLKSSKNT